MNGRSNLKRPRENDDEQPHYTVKDKLAKLETFKRSILAIAGADFVLIASENRLIFNNNTFHKHFKLFPITSSTVLGTLANLGQAISFTSMIKYCADLYEIEHSKSLTTESLLSMMKIMLYNYRLSRAFLGSLLVGMDTDGKGAVFKYDDIYGFSRCSYYAIGGGRHTFMQQLSHDIDGETNTKQRAFDIALKCFRNASRSIVGFGNRAMFKFISKDGIEEQIIKLK